MQSLPAAFCALSGNPVLNVACPGWGPHHVLAEIRAGRIEELARWRVAHAVYSAIEEHAARAAGHAPWDRFGPRFVVDGSEVRRVGSFADEPAQVGLVRRQLLKSDLFRAAFVDWRRATSAEVATSGAIVGAIRGELAARHPGAQFHVVFWDMGRRTEERPFLAALRERGIDVILVSDVLPGLAEHPERWVFPVDGHPRAAAYAEVAAVLARRLGTE